MATKHSILFILHLPPPVHGSSMVGRFIKESNKINECFACRYLNLLASKNVSDSGKVNLLKLTSFVSIWFKLLKELLFHKPDTCYFAITSTGAAFYRDVLLILLLKIFRVKRVYHMHNKGVRDYQEQTIHDLFYRFVFKNAEVILLSGHLYPDIQKYVSKEQVHICTNGIPEPKDFKKPSKKTSGPVQILFLSNLIQSKGVLVLLQACAQLKQRGLQFQCTFIGGEGDLSGLEMGQKISALGLKGMAEYVGKKYGKEKEEAFNRADIFAFPTYYEKECLPLVLLEAMQHSLPIVSTPEGGIQDIVDDGENGYVVPQKEVEALADKLEALIKDQDLREKMGTAGRKKYEDRFTLQSFENCMTNILQHTLNTP